MARSNQLKRVVEHGNMLSLYCTLSFNQGIFLLHDVEDVTLFHLFKLGNIYLEIE